MMSEEQTSAFGLDNSAATIVFQPRAFRTGIKAALPIVLGYVPIGIAYGALARHIGLNLWQITLMSLVVFAGSAQFIAVSLMGAGTSLVTIVITTFLVNLRHLLMSSALSPHLRRIPALFLALFAFELTDETFALNNTRLRQAPLPPADIFGVHFTAHSAWVIGSFAGASLGNFIPPGAFGIDFAMPAMFICLIVMQIRYRWDAAVAVLSGGLALALTYVTPGSSYIAIAASVVAATVGMVIAREK